MTIEAVAAAIMRACPYIDPTERETTYPTLLHSQLKLDGIYSDPNGRCYPNCPRKVDLWCRVDDQRELWLEIKRAITFRGDGSKNPPMRKHIMTPDGEHSALSDIRNKLPRICKPHFAGMLLVCLENPDWPVAPCIDALIEAAELDRCPWTAYECHCYPYPGAPSERAMYKLWIRPA